MLPEFSKTQQSMGMNEVNISEMISHNERIHQVIFLEEGTWRGFPGVQQLRLCASIAGGTGLILGQGTKIVHAPWPSQKKGRKERKNVLNNLIQSNSLNKTMYPTF